MIWEEGGVKIENTVLFGKYQLSRVIGQGRNGTVYLASHIELEEHRAIKRVSKASVDYQQFRREALLLKELRHPGIPIVYDLEDDLEYSYLIEEYLEGDSIYDLVKSHGSLSQEAVIRYGIQICDLVHYLHSAEQTPILYLDLQPKNLLLCHQRIKLMDFDHAARITDANEAVRRYGTLGYCAPEQWDRNQSLDVSTDVFAIGCILHFMRTGTYPGNQPELFLGCRVRQLRTIIQTCIRVHKEDRYQSAEDVKQELEEIGVFKKKNISSLIIALTGSKSGVGTTHLSIGLSNYLRQKSYPNLYEEHNRSGAVLQMAQCTGAYADTYGLFRIKNTIMRPRYGEAVRLEEPLYRVVIRDCGTDWENAVSQEDVDVILLVHGGKWWESSDGERAIEVLRHCPNLVVVYNHTLPDLKLKAPQGVAGNRCVRMAWFADPFIPGMAAGACMEAILKAAGKAEKGGNQPRKFFKRALAEIGRKIGLSV